LKSLMLLWYQIASEMAVRCCTSTTKDYEVVLSRSESEGISFLTITLPNFGKDFERSLDQEFVDRRLFSGFRWKGGLPRFLGGFLDRIFDRDTGVLLENPCEEAIIAVRQLTLMFGKILLPCSDARTKSAFREFIKCEQEVADHSTSMDLADLDEFHRVAEVLFHDLFAYLDHKILIGEVIPAHGPGATADKLRGNAKWRQNVWTERLEEYLPSADFLVPNRSFEEELDAVHFLEPESEMPVSVITVPKTLKTPRIIAVEPTAMQYAQQAVRHEIYDYVDTDYRLRRMIGFRDQTPNQRLAREGSIVGTLATLDLSEASDRVSNRLVQEMLRDHLWLRGTVESCRSFRADVPGHGVIHLAKYASMGSALTFPIEAMVFLTAVFVGIGRELNTPVDENLVKRYSHRVRVFGDDIVVPERFVRSVISSLELFGAKVNERKSFWNGLFRESCGKEYYAGTDVSIVRVRRMFPSSRRDAQGVISLVSLRNQLYFAGYWQTVKWLDEMIEKMLIHFPTVLPSSPVLGRHSFLGFETQKMGKRLHNPLVKGYIQVSSPPLDPLEGHGALLKYLTKRSDKPSHDARHLERSGRPRVVNIKLGYASAI